MEQQKIDNVSVKQEKINCIETLGTMCEKIRSVCYGYNRLNADAAYDDIMKDAETLRQIVYEYELGKYYSAGAESIKQLFKRSISSKPADTENEQHDDAQNIIDINKFRKPDNRNDNK